MSKRKELRERFLARMSTPGLKSRFEPEKLLGKGLFGFVMASSDGEKATKYMNIYTMAWLSEINNIFCCKGIDGIPTIHNVDTVRQLEGMNDKKNNTESIIEGPYVSFTMDKYQSRLGRVKRFSETHTRLIYNQLLRIMQQMHSRYICHCDIKPDNIMINKDCNGNLKVYLCDFSLSKCLKYSILKYHELQSIPFRAPEIFGSRCADYAIDYFSLGMILYQMGCGEMFYTSVEKHYKLKYRQEMPVTVYRDLIMSGGYVDFIERYYVEKHGYPQFIPEILKLTKFIPGERYKQSELPQTFIENNESYENFASQCDVYGIPYSVDEAIIKSFEAWNKYYGIQINMRMFINVLRECREIFIELFDTVEGSIAIWYLVATLCYNVDIDFWDIDSAMLKTKHPFNIVKCSQVIVNVVQTYNESLQQLFDSIFTATPSMDTSVKEDVEKPQIEGVAD